MLVILVPRRRRQEDYKFEVNLGYTAIPPRKDKQIHKQKQYTAYEDIYWPFGFVVSDLNFISYAYLNVNIEVFIRLVKIKLPLFFIFI
jgi:hypothetical protein